MAPTSPLIDFEAEVARLADETRSNSSAGLDELRMCVETVARGFQDAFVRYGTIGSGFAPSHRSCKTRHACPPFKSWTASKDPMLIQPRGPRHLAEIFGIGIFRPSTSTACRSLIPRSAAQFVATTRWTGDYLISDETDDLFLAR